LNWRRKFQRWPKVSLPAVWKEAVDEVLEVEEAHVAAIVVSRVRPPLLGQHADHPLLGEEETHGRRPKDHCSDPSCVDVALGKRKLGPAPQMSPRASAGESRLMRAMSPSPVSRSRLPPGCGTGALTIGSTCDFMA
jgi:hypothetical protein